jgi:hypothetical protein
MANIAMLKNLAVSVSADLPRLSQKTGWKLVWNNK